MKVVCISDTHGNHPKLVLPDGDVLVHSGDATSIGSVGEVMRFLSWFEAQPHRYKVLIAGNHDHLYEKNETLARSLIPPSVSYLQDSMVTIEGINFYGAPWTPNFYNWAFMPERGSAQLKQKWRMIPGTTDILITHGPPFGIMDVGNDGTHVGCVDLLAELQRVKPIAHVFGHLHEGHGQQNEKPFGEWITFVNAASCNNRGKLVFKPIVLEVTNDDGTISIRP